MLMILRHGETDWNVEPRRFQGFKDISLNRKGEQQVEEFALKLDFKPDIIYASPLKRAYKTSEIIKNILEKKFNSLFRIVKHEGLKEVDCGQWESYYYNEIKEKYPQEYEKLINLDLEFRFPDGESFKELFDRFMTTLINISEVHFTENVLIVTHGGPIRIFQKIINMNNSPKVYNLGFILIEQNSIVKYKKSNP